MIEWKELTLREAGISLIDCDHKTPLPTDRGLPYIAIPQLKDGYINFKAEILAKGWFCCKDFRSIS